MNQSTIIRRLEAIEQQRSSKHDYYQDNCYDGYNEDEYRQDDNSQMQYYGQDDCSWIDEREEEYQHQDYRTENYSQGSYQMRGYQEHKPPYTNSSRSYSSPSYNYSGLYNHQLHQSPHLPAAVSYSTPRRPRLSESLYNPQNSFPTTQHQRSTSAPNCNVIRPKKNANILAGNTINKNKLIPLVQASAKYHKLIVVSKAPTLATKLARDTFFGEDILRQCTVMGCREHPGLPIEELNELKQAVFSKFPQFWPNPVEFEDIWTQCADAIGQLCKRLRRSSV